MSTRMTDSVSPATDYTEIRAYREGVGGPQVDLRVVDAGQRPERPALAQFDLAEFIRAIETELVGTWIDGPLPEVTPLDGSRVKCGNNVYHTDYDHRAEAMERLALARYLEANPPIDEAQVEALAKTLNDNDLGNRLARADLERLVKAGVRAPEAGDDQ